MTAIGKARFFAAAIVGIIEHAPPRRTRSGRWRAVLVKADGSKRTAVFGTHRLACQAIATSLIRRFKMDLSDLAAANDELARWEADLVPTSRCPSR